MAFRKKRAPFTNFYSTFVFENQKSKSAALVPALPGILLVLLISLLLNTANYSQVFQKGDILQFIKDVKANMPGMNSRGFVIPTNSQITAFEKVFTELKKLNFQAVQDELNNYQYTLIAYYDNTIMDTLYIIKENTPIKRGWGTFIYYPDGRMNLAIECPHPLWDTNTPEFGIRLFTALKNKYYMVAGTHRYANPDSSSDAAHQTQTIFHAAHRVLTQDTAIQIHGFDKSSYRNYPDAVISNGTLYPPAVLYKIREKFWAAGFTAGVFGYSTYDSLWKLGATQNVQGLFSNSNGRTFIHVEHDYPLRTETVKTDKAINAHIAAFSSLTGVLDERKSGTGFLLKQNYPNPFNPETKICYTVPSTGRVTLRLYNILGKEISKPIDCIQECGEYEHTLRASNLFPAGNASSGVYFYNLQIRDIRSGNSLLFSETKKMVLIK